MSGLFSVPKPPAPVAPPPMPEPDDEAARLAKRRSLADSRRRSGVLSTIRPSAGGTLGARNLLGGARAPGRGGPV